MWLEGGQRELSQRYLIAVYTYVGNTDPYEATTRLLLRGGALVLEMGHYADITADEFYSLAPRFILSAGQHGLPARPPGKAVVNLRDLADVEVDGIVDGDGIFWNDGVGAWLPAHGSSGGGSDSVLAGIMRVFADDDLSGHRLVSPQPDDGVLYASSVTLAGIDLPVWLTNGAIMNGEQGFVTYLGVISEPSWAWISGQAVYLGANGFLTQVTPTFDSGFVFSLQVALATSPTELFFNPKIPVVLS